jgi:chorismate lyase / 3-hydroxybenzoate synthase
VPFATPAAGVASDSGAVLNESKLALGVEYRSRAQLPPMRDPWWRGTLGVARFGLHPAPLELARMAVANVPLSPLGGVDELYEIWRCDGPMRTGTLGRVRYRSSPQLLFGCIALPELSQEKSAGAALKANTTRAYAQIFASLEATGHRQLVRVWNYVSAITQPADAGERYWLFNNARYDSFIASDRPAVAAAPAASALGTARGSPLVIYFLAHRTAAQMLENPRQVSAYRYPAQYGPRSPTFSRAALLAEDGGTLMVSGTASIVGHDTVHSGDAAAQTREALANIGVLTDNASRCQLPRRFSLESLTYKVYVRHARDLPAVSEVMRGAIGRAASVAYLRADLCRRDLLVEIEAVGCGDALSCEATAGQLSCAMA